MKCITEERGIYKGFPYEVKLFSDGHRTGYIKLDDWLSGDGIRSWENFNENIKDALDCHGGVTYCEKESCGYLPDGYWVGFDCAHMGDIPDREAAEKAFGGLDVNPELTMLTHIIYDILGDSSIKSLEFCRKECFKMIDQLLEAPYKEVENRERKDVANDGIGSTGNN